MMKLFLIFALYLTTQSEALRCWTCENARSNNKCNRKGNLKKCKTNEHSCHNSVRRGPYGLLITKTCKRDVACTDNQAQNNRWAWIPTQCNGQVPSSVCRCCCTTDACNFEEFCQPESAMNCPPILPPRFGRKSCDFVKRANEIGSLCKFECIAGHRMVGQRLSRCVKVLGFTARYNNPAPRCVKIPSCSSIKAPQHGRMNCTKQNKPGSVCSFACDNFITELAEDGSSSEIPSPHELIGEPKITCSNGKWSALPPVCVAVTCPQLQLPSNLAMLCTYGNVEGSRCSFTCPSDYDVVGEASTTCLHVSLTKGEWSNPIPVCKRKKCSGFPRTPANGKVSCYNGRILNSECSFECDDPRNYRLIGSPTTRCIEERNENLWNNESPTCLKKSCEKQMLRNGKITCTDDNNVDSICSYQCTTPDFELDPPFITAAECLDDESWNISKPCCSRTCPPYSVVDLVIAVDSSSSIGNTNWRTIKTFVKNLINELVVGDDAARIGVFRYNRKVDTKSQILLGDFPHNKTKLLQQFDKVPYDGSGTHTGNALLHARNVLFNNRNGNRPDVPDYLVIITDGKSFDSISEAAGLLRRDRIHTFAIGVVPNKGKLDFNQLRELVTHDKDLIIADSGFDDLTVNLFSQLVDIVCTPGCL